MWYEEKLLNSCSSLLSEGQYNLFVKLLVKYKYGNIYLIMKVSENFSKINKLLALNFCFSFLKDKLID